MRLSAISSVAFATAISSTAYAMPESKLGFPIGEKSRIHTDLDLGLGYDTNVFRAAPGGEIADLKATIRPGIRIEVPGSAIQFNLGAKLSIEQFFGLEDGQDAHTEVGGDVSLALRAGSRASILGFELNDTLSHTPTAFANLGSAGASELRFPHTSNRGAAHIVLRPGGGALEFRAGYTNAITIFDGLPDDQRHGVHVQAKLRFLPRTAALFDANLAFYSAAADAENGTVDQKAAPYDVSLGLQGQLTSRLRTVLRVGFGDALSFQEGDGFFGATDATRGQRTLIAMAQFAYAFAKKSEVELGYTRAVQPVIILRSYVADAVGLRFKLGLVDRLSLGLLGEYAFRTFAGTAGKSQLLTIDARVDYQFFEFLTGGIAYQLLNQTASDGAGTSTLLEEYTRHLALFNVGLHY